MTGDAPPGAPTQQYRPRQPFLFRIAPVNPFCSDFPHFLTLALPVGAISKSSRQKSRQTTDQGSRITSPPGRGPSSLPAWVSRSPAPRDPAALGTYALASTRIEAVPTGSGYLHPTTAGEPSLHHREEAQRCSGRRRMSGRRRGHSDGDYMPIAGPPVPFHLQSYADSSRPT